MKRYNIAGLKVDMKANEETILRQAAKYLSENDGTPADIVIAPTREYIEKMAEKNGGVTHDLQEYMSTGARFYVELIKHQGFMLHSSAVAVDGKAYLFSAPSGTGKSTHTSLWLKHFGSDKAVIINDDKPAIRLVDDKFYVMGTPWSGKTDQNEDIAVEAAGVAFIERSETNRIERVCAAEAIKLIMWQTVRPTLPHNMDALLTTLDRFIRTVPVYKLYCNISDEAVQVSYNEMKKGF